MKIKYLIILLVFFLVHSCSGIDGKRSSKSDEFLIEKKNPLVMPPDIDDLPEPNKNTNIDREGDDNNFKESLSSKSSSTKKTTSQTSATLKESIMKQIEQ
tara:strand:- start:98 stop:397 length:300 start_codon:yes stop_codon:yes gene_type:complete